MLSEINPPSPPPAPEYEPENVGDQGHNWLKCEDRIDIFAYDGDTHNGPECVDCGYYFCHHCSRSGYDDRSCARKQAKNRNETKRSNYAKAMDDYNIQMRYYEKEVAPHVTRR